MAFIGDTVRLCCHFRTFDGQLIDPDDIAITIYDEQSNVLHTSPITSQNRESVGAYFYDYVVPNSSGDLTFEYKGTYETKPILSRNVINTRWR